MNRNHAPGTLDTELLEEGSGNDPFVLNEGVRVQERATDDTDDDDAESAPEDLAAISNSGAAGNSTQVGNDLRHSDGVGREEELVRQHGWVEVLAAVGHEVEAGHEQDEVDE